MIIVLAGLFLATNAPVLTARFGPSHDGFNGAVWASGSRAMRHDGVVESRFGGRGGVFGEYANHPPGLLAETYVAESIGGEHHIVTRAPAWIGSILSIALLGWLLLEAGFRRGTVAAAVAMVTTTQLFLVYGSMLDTPVTSLPFALTALIVAQRVVQNRPPRALVLVLVGALAVCSGWQSTTMLAFAGLWIFAGARADRRRMAGGGWMAVGGVLGLTVTLSWIRWVYGSLTPLADQEGTRASGVGLAQSLTQQATYLADLLPYVWVLGLVGLVVVVATRSRSRPLALVTTGAVVAYGVYFRQGAFIHDYWNYALVIPLSVALAALAEAAVPLVRKMPSVRAELLGTALVGAVVLCSVVTPSVSAGNRRAGVETSPLVDAAVRMAPTRGPVIGLLPPLNDATAPWARYETHRPPLVLQVRNGSVMQTRADVPVLLWLSDVDPLLRLRLLQMAAYRSGSWILVPSRDAVRFFGSS